MFLSVARAETGGFNTAEAAVFFVGGCKLLPGVWEAGALWMKSGGTIAVTRSNVRQVFSLSTVEQMLICIKWLKSDM